MATKVNNRNKSPRVAYREYLQLEKALRPASVEAYMSDIQKLDDYLGGADGALLAAALDDLRGFLASLADIGVHARSQARILSSIRSFYGFLQLDGYIENDPTETLRSPKIGMHLPAVQQR